MKNVNDRVWKTFVIEDIFEIMTGASISQADFNSGDMPRVTASDKNNGIRLFTNKLKHKNFRENGNFISYSFLGSAFYHEYDVSLDMKIHGLKIKGRNLNKYLGQFLVTCLRHTILTPSYGNQLSSKDLLIKKIILPVTNSGDPDWDFMEDYIREKSIKVKEDYRFSGYYVTNDTREITEVSWSAFYLKDIFCKIQRGKRLIKDEQMQGKTSYISSTMFDNGTDGFIDNKKGIRQFENCLTIANSGSVGSVFYHKYKFVASDHVTALIGENLNEFQYKFIASCLRNLQVKYSFNREINDKRIKTEKVLLPVKLDGTPDFAFMEQYMKRMENKVLEEVQNKF